MQNAATPKKSRAKSRAATREPTTAMVHMGLDPRILAILEKVAEHHGLNRCTIIRLWLAERAQAEIAVIEQREAERNRRQEAAAREAAERAASSVPKRKREASAAAEMAA